MAVMQERERATTHSRPEPDVSESYFKAVEAPQAVVESVADRLDLVGPLVQSLIAVGVGEHIVTPRPNGLVWRFDAAGACRVAVAWSIDVEAESDEVSVVSLDVEMTASDDTARERLLEAWPLIGPLVDVHAHRVLHAVEQRADEFSE
jgi:hypothetical protein